MASRDEMREARKAAGLCLHDTCGNKALTPVFDYCEKHIPPHQVITRRRRKKRSPSN